MAQILQRSACELERGLLVEATKKDLVGAGGHQRLFGQRRVDVDGVGTEVTDDPESLVPHCQVDIRQERRQRHRDPACTQQVA